MSVDVDNYFLARINRDKEIKDAKTSLTSLLFCKQGTNSKQIITVLHNSIFMVQTGKTLL